MIANWTCLFVCVCLLENCNSLSAYCVRGLFVQTSYIKVENFGWGKFEYYKSMGGGGTIKKGEGGPNFFKVQWREAKGGIMIFDLNLMGGKTLEETTKLWKDYFTKINPKVLTNNTIFW